MSCWKTFYRSWLAAWALGLCLPGLAQSVDETGIGLMPYGQGEPTLRAPEPLITRSDQIWEVETLMGQPVPPGEQPARLLMRSGSVQILDGCNRFSGRFTHDAQGQFRLASLRGTHNACTNQSRHVALLNSALVMANQLQFGDAMVLRNGDMELARLVPAPRQDADAKDDFRFSLVDPPFRGSSAAPARGRGAAHIKGQKAGKAGKTTAPSKAASGGKASTAGKGPSKAPAKKKR